MGEEFAPVRPSETAEPERIAELLTPTVGPAPSPATSLQRLIGSALSSLGPPVVPLEDTRIRRSAVSVTPPDVIQRKHVVSEGAKQGMEEWKGSRYFQADGTAEGWMVRLEDIYSYLDNLSGDLKAEDLAAMLAEDVDRHTFETKLVEEFEARADQIALLLDQYAVAYKQAPQRQGRPPRKGGRGPVDHTQYKDTFHTRLTHHARELRKLEDEIRLNFPAGEGGFGAKGRAHAMDTQDGPSADFAHKSPWLSGITLDGVALDTKESLYSSEQKANDPVGAFAFSPPGFDDSSLKPVQDTHTGDWRGPKVRRKDRDGTQASQMGGLSAASYAAFTKRKDATTTRWEWLHIRAASLGGVTDGSNLVLGTRDANTHMIPFEANIRDLVGIVHRSKKFERVTATFKVLGQQGFSHVYESIVIEWKVQPTDSSTAAPSGSATFYPLRTDSSISKADVDIIQGALKTIRGSLDVT